MKQIILKPFVWSAFLIFCLLFQGCDFIYGLLDKKGAEEKELIGEVIPFEKNHTIEEVQILLKLYGYNPGGVDGFLGGRTREAIAEFQRDNGLEETRYVDQQTWELISLFKTYELVQDAELNIRMIQQIFHAAGCDPGEPDGKLGPKTKEAIKCFQEKHQLKTDGKIGYKTLSAMVQYLEIQILD